MQLLPPHGPLLVRRGGFERALLPACPHSCTHMRMRWGALHSLDHIGATSSANTPEVHGIYEQQMEAGELQIWCVLCEHDKTHDAPPGSQGRSGEHTTEAQRAERAASSSAAGTATDCGAAKV